MLRLRLVNGLIIEVAVGEIEITSYKKLAHVELFNPSSNFRGNYSSLLSLPHKHLVSLNA